MSHRPYVLTKGASADLRDISRHTASRRGDAQRQAYVQELKTAANDVALGQGVFKN